MESTKHKSETKAVYIFKINNMLDPADLEPIKAELKKQIEEGTVVIDSRLSYVAVRDRKNGEDIHPVFVKEIDCGENIECRNVRTSYEEGRKHGQRLWQSLLWIIPLSISISAIIISLITVLG